MRPANIIIRSAMLSSLIVTAAHGAQVTYRFTTTVAAINPAAPGFPASLSGVVVGDAIIGTISYSDTSPPAPNVFPAPYSLATYYVLNSASIRLNIDGALFTGLSGPRSAFVWNDDPIGGGGSNDGLIFLNVPSPGAVQVGIGNLSLATSMFASEALPNTTLRSAYGLQMVTAGGASWLTSAGWSDLTRVTNCSGDVNGDVQVNVNDLLAVITSWGPCVTPCTTAQCLTDIAPPAGDCQIDVNDLLAVISSWGACP